MKKNYVHPWLKIVEIDGRDIVCTSGEDDRVTPMNIELDVYDTYDAPDTGSDF